MLDEAALASCEGPVAMSSDKRRKKRVMLMASSLEYGAQQIVLETCAVAVGAKGSGGCGYELSEIPSGERQG